MATKRNSKLDGVVQNLRAKYTQMLRDGLGREGLTPAEELEVNNFVESCVVDPFRLYAGLEVSKALGIESEFRETVGMAPVTDDPEKEIE